MMIISCMWYRQAVLFIIRFIWAHNKTNAAFKVLSGEAFLKSSRLFFMLMLPYLKKNPQTAYIWFKNHLHIEPYGDLGMNVCGRGHGHMTEIAAMSIYDKKIL